MNNNNNNNSNNAGEENADSDETEFIMAIPFDLNSILKAAVLRFIIPMIVFAPFFFYPITLGPAILAYFCSRFMADQVEKVFTNEFAGFYMMRSKMLHEEAIEKKNRK